MQLQPVIVLQLPWGSRLELSALLLRKLNDQRMQNQIGMLPKASLPCKDYCDGFCFSCKCQIICYIALYAKG